ncbi:MAG: hypothetical protein ACPG2Y_01220, partial [Acholeplasmataceae bacterium]
ENVNAFAYKFQRVIIPAFYKVVVKPAYVNEEEDKFNKELFCEHWGNTGRLDYFHPCKDATMCDEEEWSNLVSNEAENGNMSIEMEEEKEIILSEEQRDQETHKRGFESDDLDVEPPPKKRQKLNNGGAAAAKTKTIDELVKELRHKHKDLLVDHLSENSKIQYSLKGFDKKVTEFFQDPTANNFDELARIFQSSDELMRQMDAFRRIHDEIMHHIMMINKVKKQKGDELNGHQ